MLYKQTKKTILLILLALIVWATSASELKLPKIFADNMVLQRNIPCKIWGWAEPNKKVSLLIDGEETYTYSNQNGEWTAYLPPHEAGGPYQLEISSDTTIRFPNILFGEVWFASGQSNMEFRMKDISDGRYDSIMAKANFPDIRYFKVERALSSIPQNDLKGGDWVTCNKKTVKEFSAVGWFFIKKIYETQNVPVAIIESSWGATPAQAWTSQKMLETLPYYREEARKLDLFSEEEWQQKFIEADSLESLKWSIVSSTDETKKRFASPKLDDSSWQTVILPRTDMKDVVWVRKTFDLPANIRQGKTGKEFVLNIGQAYIFQDVFLNGEKLQYKDLRDIRIPANKVKKKNTLAIRATSPWSNLVHIGKKDAMFLKSPDGTILNLEGEWKFSNSIEPGIPEVTYFHQKPSYIFNAMVNPVAGYSMKGVIWYQGESNQDDAKEYYQLFSTMIQDWRTKWKLGDFPFLYVQLANYLYKKDTPTESKWAEVREAQRKTLAFPNTGMAVTIDIGEARNIHPFNKKDVGERLSLVALKLAYEEDKHAFSGPVPEFWRVDNGKVSVSFKYCAKELVTKNAEAVKGFAVAGDDKKFQWADAQINGNTVIINCPEIANPKYIRYAWADNPECNLYNSALLPASPFEIALDS